MKNLILCAVLALGIGVPGMAHTTPICIPTETAAPSNVETILKAAAEQSEYSYGCLCDLYDAGNVTIDKTDDGAYRVTVIDGGAAVILILEGF